MEDAQTADQTRQITPQDQTTAGTIAKQAEEAHKENDIAAMTELCLKALEVDPNNRKALNLMARYGGWDAELLEFNVDVALNAAKKVLDLAAHDARTYLASKIFYARKAQIAEQLDAAMKATRNVDPERVHSIMMTWKRLMEEVPYLPAELLADEADLCEDLCRRSKRAIFPNERVIHTASLQFNDKESYADTLRAIAQARSGEEAERERENIERLQARYEACMATYREKAAGELTPGQERQLLLSTIKELNAVLKEVRTTSERPIYEEMLERLSKHRGNLKSFHVLQARKADSTLETVKKKIADIDAAFAPIIDPIRAEIDTMEARLAKLKKK